MEITKFCSWVHLVGDSASLTFNPVGVKFILSLTSCAVAKPKKSRAQSGGTGKPELVTLFGLRQFPCMCMCVHNFIVS